MTVLQMPSRLPVMLTKQQLATRLERSTRWVELQVAKGMPAGDLDRMGRRKFDLAAVEAWMDRREPRARPVDRVGELEREMRELRGRLEQLERSSA